MWRRFLWPLVHYPLRYRFKMIISLERIVGVLCGVSASLMLLFLVSPSDVCVRESLENLMGVPWNWWYVGSWSCLEKCLKVCMLSGSWLWASSVESSLFRVVEGAQFHLPLSYGLESYLLSLPGQRYPTPEPLWSVCGSDNYMSSRPSQKQFALTAGFHSPSATSCLHLFISGSENSATCYFFQNF